MSGTELQRAERVDPAEATLGETWRALVVAAGVMAIASFFWLPSLAPELDDELLQWTYTFLAMTAGLHLLTVVMLKQVLAHVTGARYRAYCLARWVLSEAVAVFGAVLAVLGFGWAWTVGFFGLAGLLLALERPGPADRRRFVDQFR